AVWMGAGPVPEIWHRALNALAWLVRLRLLPSLAPFATLIYRAVNVLSFGEHRGGMFVAVEGAGPDGEPIARSWHLLAEGSDGPLIPSMAAEAVIRRCLAGRAPAAGARAAATDLELADYAPLFARRAISTGVWQTSPADARAPLYRRLLGDAWHALPAPLQAMHALDRSMVAEGVAEGGRGRGWLARVAAGRGGLSRAGSNVPAQGGFSA